MATKSLVRLIRLNVTLLALGGAAAAIAVASLGGFGSLARLREVHPSYVLVMLAITSGCVLVRFIRWQFLMRHAGFRVPERPSLRIYLASLVGMATPAYIGEAIRGAFLRRGFGVPLRASLFVLVIERLLDVAALALLALLTAGTWWLRGAMAAVLLLTALAGWLATVAGRAFGTPESAIVAVRRADILIDSFLMTLVAWIPSALLVQIATASLDHTVGLVQGIGIFSSSVLLGGLTLMPAGIAATGSVVLFQLDQAGIATPESIAVVALLRLTTSGVTLVAGSIALAFLLKAKETAVQGDAAAVHFDEIAIEYGQQFKEHVWSHLLERKTSFIAGALPAPSKTTLGLDLGCGLGIQCNALKKRGFRVVGMDVSKGLAARARESGITVAAGSAMALPCRDQSLDFVYAVGVLHHLPNRAAQRQASQEIARVLKPGGRFLVHETNTRNPLFRFYMGYVFPMLKKIDEGTEWWIEPWQWRAIHGLRLVEVKHFTFMPDFIPAFLMKPALWVDRWLESTRLRTYSVHYMAVLERDPNWQPALQPGEEPFSRSSVSAKAKWVKANEALNTPSPGRT